MGDISQVSVYSNECPIGGLLILKSITVTLVFSYLPFRSAEPPQREVLYMTMRTSGNYHEISPCCRFTRVTDRDLTQVYDGVTGSNIFQ